MSALYPNVPIALGVPAVLRRAGINDIGSITAFAESALLGADSPDLDAPPAQQWGVYNEDGDLIIEPDSVGAVEFQKEYRISDFPVEEGGFQSYNKVETPYDARVIMYKGGNDAERLDFLATVEAAIASLDLYSVMTPSRGYLNANLTRYDYAQAASGGATLLKVELAFEQVRTTAQASFTNSKEPQSADVVNDGAVQGVAPTPAQTPPVPPS